MSIIIIINQQLYIMQFVYNPVAPFSHTVINISMRN